MSAYLKMIPLALTVATLASCADEPEQNEPGKTAVSNKILEGSIRDDMLPYDTVQSKPPLADPESSTDNTEKGREQAARGEDAGSWAPCQDGGWR